MRTNYKNTPKKIASYEPFRGNSASATLENGVYTIYSYNTPIYKAVNGKFKMFDDSFYSSTTSRLQNIIRKTLDIK